HGEDAARKVEPAFDHEMVRLRDRLLPLVRLSEVLGRPLPFTAATRMEMLHKVRSPKSEGGVDGISIRPPVFFAVVKAGAQRFGLVVDQLLNTEEIVVKPMHPVLKPLRCYAGATIMGDGRVALILDIEGIARHAGIAVDTGQAPLRSVEEQPGETQP